MTAACLETNAPAYPSPAYDAGGIGFLILTATYLLVVLVERLSAEARRHLR